MVFLKLYFLYIFTKTPKLFKNLIKYKIGLILYLEKMPVDVLLRICSNIAIMLISY